MNNTIARKKARAVHLANLRTMSRELCIRISKSVQDHDWDKVNGETVDDLTHAKNNRHHLNNYMHDDANLIDLLEMCMDGVDASRRHNPEMSETQRMEHSWNTYLKNLDFEKMVKNTIKLLQKSVKDTYNK